MMVDVRGSGKGEGISSTESEWGFRKGPEVIGRLLMAPGVEFGNAADPGAPRGVGGGDVPILLRNLRVIWGLA